MNLTSKLLAFTLASPLPALSAPQDAQAPAAARSELAVLYVGAAEGPRTADFVRFLGEHFDEVGTAIYPEFVPSDADAFDVVILDTEMHPKENSIGIGPQPTLPMSYARATILINGPGVIVADRGLKSKIDWL